MPALALAAFIGALASIAGTLVGRVLLSLGIGYFVYSGVDTSITFARDFAVGHILSLSPQTVATAGALQIGRSISILSSALVARMTLNGLTGGSIKKMLVK